MDHQLELLHNLGDLTLNPSFLCLYSPSPLGGEGLGVRSPRASGGYAIGLFQLKPPSHDIQNQHG